MKVWSQTCRWRAPLIGVVCLAFVTPVAATDICDKFFNPEGDGLHRPVEISLSWHNDDNWIPSGEPGPADIVCVIGDGGFNVEVTQPVTVAGLALDSWDSMLKLKVLSTSFALNGNGHVGGETKLKVNDGAVLRTDGGGSLEVHSTLVIDDGTVEVDVDLYGHLNFAGTGNLTGLLVTHPGSVIEFEDTKPEAHIVFGQGFENFGEINLYGSIPMSIEVVSGSLVNADGGVIATQSGVGDGIAVPELRAEIINHGLIDVNGLDLHLIRDGSLHENALGGTLEVTNAQLDMNLGGLVDVPSNFTNYGTATVGTGGSIRVFGAAGLLDVPSNFTNYGTATVGTGGSIRVFGSAGESSPMTMSNLGSIAIDVGGTVAVTAANFDNPSSGEITGSGNLDLSQAASVLFDGAINPGSSPGVLTIEGDFTEGPNARITIEIAGESPGSGHDLLEVTGVMAADGSLDVVLIDSYHPVGGEQFGILAYDSLLGWFSHFLLPQLQHLLVWNTIHEDHGFTLEVVCEGTQLSLSQVPDRNPVSIGYEYIYDVSVRNLSTLAATGVLVSNVMPPELVFRPDLSSPECVLVGAAVECSMATVAPAAVWEFDIAVEPVIAGLIQNTTLVDSWECDTFLADNQAMSQVEAVAAAPCDSNFDLNIDADDLVPAVDHIFGQPAVGNPDCRLGDGITADDLAAIIDACQ